MTIEPCHQHNPTSELKLYYYTYELYVENDYD
jgi:hypothetical protein